MALPADPANGSAVMVSGMVSKMMQPTDGHVLIAADRLAYFTPSTYSMLSMSPAVGPSLVPCVAREHAKIARVKMSLLIVSASVFEPAYYVEYVVPAVNRRVAWFEPVCSELRLVVAQREPLGNCYAFLSFS
jgi:hypothetical protein